MTRIIKRDLISNPECNYLWVIPCAVKFMCAVYVDHLRKTNYFLTIKCCIVLVI